MQVFLTIYDYMEGIEVFPQVVGVFSSYAKAYKFIEKQDTNVQGNIDITEWTVDVGNLGWLLDNIGR